jgi:putative transposase
LPVAKGHPVLWVRLARPIPYPVEQVRAVTLLADGGRLWLAVTAAVPIQPQHPDPGRVAGVDLGIIHPYAAVADEAALLGAGAVTGSACGVRRRVIAAASTRLSMRLPSR